MSKKDYMVFSESNPVPIFSQWWWLDTVCENWDVILYEKGGQIWGSFPFCIRNFLGFKIITMPPLTQTLGPYIKYPPSQKYYKKISWEIKVMEHFIKNLPRHDFFFVNFHKSVTNWLPFYWNGFSQTTRYTYVIPKGVSEDELESEYETDVRRRRRKAQKLGVNVVEDEDIETLYELALMTFSRKGKKLPYSLELLKKLYFESSKRGRSKILLANYDGTKIAGGLFVWDDQDVYYLVGGIHPDYKDVGGMDLLLHEAILFALRSGRNFDFEGSVVRSIERYFRSFGARQIRYFTVYRAWNPIFKIALIMKRYC